MSHPFDEFSKSLSEASVPRRESLRRLAAVFAGAMLSPLGLETASADPQPRRYRATIQKSRRAPDPCETFCKCRNAKQQSNCLAACRSCGGNTSRIGGSCGSYVCCSTASCNGVCSDLKSDPNCGACGNTCGAKGQSCCGGRCADLKSDSGNCGACGRVCPSGSQCVNGTCRGCAAGQTRCGTTCVNLSTDAANCGACGVRCANYEVCIDGFCAPGGGVDCGYGAAYCGGICINILSDSANCGGCGIECAADEICTWGACLGTCSGC